MKIVRFSAGGREQYGSLAGDTISPLEGSLGHFAPVSGAAAIPLASVHLLAPVTPGKIVAIGVNYHDHATEMSRQLPAEPLIFLKPPSAVINPGDAIVHPPQTSRMDFEGELAIIIGKVARNVAASSAREYMAGFTCMNDVTARDLQARDVQFTRAKGFDTFAPLGPAIATGIDPSDLALETRLNGEVRQHSRTSQLIFGCDHLLSYVSHIMTLQPGDIISTGTPAGVGPMKPGDVVEVEIEGIGCLRNLVAAPD